MARNSYRSMVRLVPAAAAAVLALGISGGSETATSPPPPANDVSKVSDRTLDLAGMDTATQACSDFYQYGNGTWLANNPIPPDRPRWGSFDELRQKNLDNLHGILDRLAADKSAPAGSDERKLGDFYGACMDEAAIETKGLSPIEPELAKIDAIRDLAGLRAEITRLQKMGVNALFTFGSEEDRKDSSRVIAALLQAGLGLPDRDYYTKTDEKSVELRKKYVAHVQKMLELAGSPSAKAAADAKAILDLETKLAQASMNNVDFRDPDKTHHPMTIAAFSQATPNLGWEAYFTDQGLPASTAAERLAARFLQGRERPGEVRAAPALEDLPALAPARRRGADALEEVRGREFRLLRQDALRDAREPAALEALRDRDGQRDGDGPRADLREGVLSARGEEARRRARPEPAPRPEGRHPDPRLDERCDEEGRGREGRDVLSEDRLSREVARLLDAHDHARRLRDRRARGRRVRVEAGRRQDRKARGPQRLRHDAAHGQRLLQRGEERDRVSGRDLPAPLLLRGRG